MKHTIWIGLVMSIISAYVGRVNTPQNAEFIALYQAIINGGLAEPEGSGKAAAATATVSDIAQNVLSANSSLAQNILAVYKNTDYIRHGEPVNLPGKSLLKEPAFKLMPNPAQDQIAIEFTKPIKPRQTLQIYNLQGQLVVTQKDIAQNTPVNVAMLQNGMYFCRLSDEADVVKLVIVR